MLNLLRKKPKSRWFEAGLHFQCQQCGRCCGGRPGYVWVTEEEIKAIADYLNLSQQQFRRRYTRKEGRRISLKEKGNYDCIFLEHDGQSGRCAIYPVRPTQCRTWPFWKSNLQSPDHWQTLTSNCPGVNRGPGYDAEQIERLEDASPC